LSSVKVNGESTKPGRPYTANDIPAPKDPYAVSKLEAEEALKVVGQKTGMEVVIVRTPLVYGPGVKANFASMMRWVKSGLPLPLGAIDFNKRSMVGIDNLVDMIGTCVSHPAAANRTFLVSDDEDLSTADLLRRMGMAMQHPVRLFYVPAALLRFGAFLFNRSGEYKRLCNSLQLDIAATQRVLNWRPVASVDEGLGWQRRGIRSEAPV